MQVSDNLPKVCVLLAAYNGMEYIEQQLKSILEQEYVDVTVFISVDLSSDNTYEWCCEYAQHQAKVKVLPYGEKFGGAAPNFFRLIRDVDFSNFDYASLADQDDIWLNDKLITACKNIESGGFSAYSANVLAFWEDGHKQLIDKAQPQRKYDFLFEAAGPGCSYVLKVEPLQKFKGLLLSRKDEITKIALHDWLIYAFFRIQNYRWFIHSDYKVYYRQHADNQVGVNKGWRAALMRLHLFRYGWYREQVELISYIVGFEAVNFNFRWEILKNIRQLRRNWKDRVALFALVLIGLY